MRAADIHPNSSQLVSVVVPHAYWLPPHGRGNGLDAAAWAPVADVPAGYVESLLGALAEAGVPGHAAELHPARTGGRHRIWVDSLKYATAEDALRVPLALLERSRQRGQTQTPRHRP